MVIHAGFSTAELRLTHRKEWDKIRISICVKNNLIYHVNIISFLLRFRHFCLMLSVCYYKQCCFHHAHIGILPFKYKMNVFNEKFRQGYFFKVNLFLSLVLFYI